MRPVTLAFLGDIFGAPGRRVVEQTLPKLRADHAPDLVIANAENARSGSGLSPELYRNLREAGIDGVTLGDHVYRCTKILPVLEQADEPIIRPANLSRKAVGRTLLRMPPAGERTRAVYAFTVLGRVFFPLPADDPFAAADAMLAQIPEPNPIVIVEAHMEATSEKAALAHYLDGRVTAVVGTHTHVPTADARVLRKGTGFISDVGMCGPYDSIIGRDVSCVLKHMTTGMYVGMDVAEGDAAMCGVVIRADAASGRCLGIERIEYR
jgi:2',3'-cyclic-nucleotide 2'-phosphodiesterase